MTIYKSTRTLPYVYMCREKNSPYFYIGYRYRNYAPSSEDLGIKYFTSNSYVKENFNNFNCTVVAEFFTKEAAYEFESVLIKELKSKYLINHSKNQKRKTYKEVIVNHAPKICALPECSKVHHNWRSKCCCSQHQKKYAALRRHNKI